MAFQNPDGIFSLPAAADFSATKWPLVVINTSGQFALCGAGAIPHGTLDNAPKAGEQARAYLLGPVLKAKAGTGGVTLGAKLSSNATGDAVISVTSGHACFGIALEAAAAGEIFTYARIPDLAPVP
jgi:hypothetical protein